MKSSPFHNRIRLLALLAAFVLACAGCVWLFLHSGRANRRQEAEPVSASAQTAEAAALPNFAAPVLYDAQSEVTEELPDDHAWQQEIFPYGDDLVQLNYGGDDALFAAVSALTGSTVLAFPAQDFPDLGTLRCASAALAPDGTLWLLGYDETTQEFALQGSGQGEPARLGVCPFDYASPDAFAVCGDYAAVLGRIGTERILVMYDRATGQMPPHSPGSPFHRGQVRIPVLVDRRRNRHDDDARLAECRRIAGETSRGSLQRLRVHFACPIRACGKLFHAGGVQIKTDHVEMPGKSDGQRQADIPEADDGHRVRALMERRNGRQRNRHRQSLIRKRKAQYSEKK